MNADNDEKLNAYMALMSWRKNFLSNVKINIGEAFQESNFHMMAELAKDDPEVFTLLREDLREAGVPLTRLDMALKKYLDSEQNDETLKGGLSNGPVNVAIGAGCICNVSVPAGQGVQISFGNSKINIYSRNASFFSEKEARK